jgi:hypothetical protein
MTKAQGRWERAIKLKIRPDEIIGLIEEMTARRDSSEPSDIYTSLAILAERYKGKRNATDRILCISTRMTCLSELMSSNDPRLRGYTKSTEDPSCTVTNAAMFHAAALCPVRVDDKRTWFDLDEFFDIALKEAGAEGSA